MNHKLYAQLRNAVLMYDSALRKWGLATGAERVDSAELDRLWSAVLEAADIDSPARQYPPDQRTATP